MPKANRQANIYEFGILVNRSNELVSQKQQTKCKIPFHEILSESAGYLSE